MEAFEFGEMLENNVSFADLNITPTPGTLAGLRGYWRGKNKYENEKAEALEERQRRQQRGRHGVNRKGRQRYQSE